MVILKNHQTKTRNFVKQEESPGVLVYHGLGSGKTLTSIAIAQNSESNVVVIVPASLIDNYKKEIEKFGNNLKNFTIMSFEKSAKLNLNLKDKILIVDEAHRLRNPYRMDAKNIINSSKEASKIILLTGTPFVNRPSDIAPLINIIKRSNVLPLKKSFDEKYVKVITEEIKTPVKLFGKTIYTKSTFIKTLGINDKDDFKEKVSGCVSFFQNENVSNYPSKTTHFKPVKMSSLQYELHKKIEDANLSKSEIKLLKNNYTVQDDENSKGAAQRLNAYLSGTRKISNVVNGEPSPKMLEILKMVKQAQKPVVVYSNFISQGVGLFQTLLKKNGVSNRLFTGSTSQKEKKQIVEDYNSRKFDVLCLSRSGSEGLDLKRTRQVHIMEPYWNSSQLEQVIGRAVRYKSHNSLPLNERNVDIYHWYSVYGGVFSTEGNNMSADKYLVNMSKHKEKLISKFIDALKEANVI